MEWRDFLDTDFNPKDADYKTRDYVITKCSRCKTNSRVQVSNLKKQIKIKDTHYCWGCSMSISKSNNPQFIQKVRNYFDKFGVDVPFEGFFDEVKANIRYLFRCYKCSKEVMKTLANLLRHDRPPACRSCAGKDSYTFEAIQKKESTMLERYGAKNPNQAPEIKAKIAATNKEKYGEEGSIGLARKAFVEKYGVANPFDLPEIHEKVKQTNLERYGAANSKQATALQKTGSLDQEELANKLIKRLEETGFYCNHPAILEEFQTTGTVLTRLLNKYNRRDLLRLEKITSQGEQELAVYVKSLGVEIKENDRTLISPSEIDILIPSHNLGIEYHGLYWHSSEVKDNKYVHALKRQWAEAKGFSLLQIYEDEWVFKRTIVESMIKSRLGLSSVKINARDCIIKNVPYTLAQEFIQNNHLMGKSTADQALGLYFENQLIAVMSYRTKAEGLDISRFCNKLDYSIRGGFSKMLKHLITLKNPAFIQSYVDLRYGTGRSLEANSFVKEKSFLSWKWTDFKNTFNRLKCKANMDDRGLTEAQHAEELGWVKIYDAEQAKYVLKIKQP